MDPRIKPYVFLVILFTFCTPALKAEIIDSTSNGFTVRKALSISQNPDSTYRYLIRDVSLWWDPQHTFSGKATNLIIQAKANGCFCERLDNGGSVRHMTVVYVDPPKTLRMIGGIGPLQAMAIEGVMTFQLKQAGNATMLTMTYEVGGYTPGGIGKMAAIVDQVLGEQMERFRVYAESTK